MVSLVGACGRSHDRPAAAAATPDTEIEVVDVGLATPESVLYDATADVYLVSNINGSPFGEDDNGFISRLSPAGEVLDLTWIDGADEGTTLNAPKGMAIVGDLLYVTDLTVVRKFDRISGAPLGEIVVPGAGFLNDLAPAADGGVWLTDSGLEQGAEGFVPSGTDAVYHITPAGDIHTVMADTALGRPNGVTTLGDDAWVVSFGSGELYRIGDGMSDVVKLPTGVLDGIEVIGSEFLISSWEGQSVLQGPPSGPFRTVVTGVPGPADIGYDAGRNRVLIPLFQDDAVRIVPLGAGDDESTGD